MSSVDIRWKPKLYYLAIIPFVVFISIANISTRGGPLATWLQENYVKHQKVNNNATTAGGAMTNSTSSSFATTTRTNATTTNGDVNNAAAAAAAAAVVETGPKNETYNLRLDSTTSSNTSFNFHHEEQPQSVTLPAPSPAVEASLSLSSHLTIDIPFGRYDTGIKNICSALQSQTYAWTVRNDEKGLQSNITAKFSYCRDHRIGNALSQYFFNRLIAAHAGINYQLDRTSCRDPEGVISLLGEPIPVLVPPPSHDSSSNSNSSTSTSTTSSDGTWQNDCSSCMDDKYSRYRWPHACRNWNISSLVPVMKHELQIMAERTLQKHPELESEIDDVVIHLRLGDVLNGSMRNMGLLPFQAYLDIINPQWNVSTIGIVTAPVHPGSDADVIVKGLKEFLARHYPNTNITIRDSSSDNTSMVYTRLIKARKIVICTASTFCIHPTIASEATMSVMFWNAKHPNWLDRLSVGDLNSTHTTTSSGTISSTFPTISSSSSSSIIVAPRVRFVEAKDFPKKNTVKTTTAVTAPQQGMEEDEEESLGKVLVRLLSNMNQSEYQVSDYEEWNESILPYYK